MDDRERCKEELPQRKLDQVRDLNRERATITQKSGPAAIPIVLVPSVGIICLVLGNYLLVVQVLYRLGWPYVADNYMYHVN